MSTSHKNIAAMLKQLAKDPAAVEIRQDARQTPELSAVVPTVKDINKHLAALEHREIEQSSSPSA